MKQDLQNNPKIKLGDVDVPEGFQDTKNHKLRITAWIDGDIYDELQRRANNGEAGGMYQKLMNQLLRSVLFPEAAAASVTREYILEVMAEKGWVKKDKILQLSPKKSAYRGAHRSVKSR